MTTPSNDTHQRILDIAEELFFKRGYAAVTLRDIAAPLGMKHASLYYYAPEGKKQLYIEVMERNFVRHRAGITEAIAGAGGELRQQMYAVARWLVAQPPLDFSRMHQADMSEISQEQRERLMAMGYDAIRIPIVVALKQARNTGQIKPLPDLNLAAMAIVSLVGSVHNIPVEYSGGWQAQIGLQLVDMLLDGWLVT
ncbi:MAG: TetR/AcrR family transcriptional regulator [Armatimonadetes bacterium]|nr:TetR/AcrR family transcriptional regulator [Anaerolineae bacterium]